MISCRQITLVLVTLCLSSCSQLEKKNILATYEGKSLYLDDLLEKGIPPFRTKEDSLVWIRLKTKEWIKGEVFYKHAQENLGSYVAHIDKQIEEYKHTLYSYYFKENILSQNNYMEITEEELNEYFEKNKESFVLSNDIHETVILQIKKEQIPKIQSIRLLYRGGLDRFISYCKKQQIDLDTLYSGWLEEEDLSVFLPRSLEESFAKKKIIFENDSIVRLVQKMAMIKHSEIAPLGYVRNQIEVILKKKMLDENIEKYKEKLFETAQNEGEIEIY